MALQLYNREDILDFVLADSNNKISDIGDYFFADVDGEFRKAIRLPDFNRNVTSHERETLVCLDKGLNEVLHYSYNFCIYLGKCF